LARLHGRELDACQYDSTPITRICAAQLMIIEIALAAPNGGYRVSHDRRTVTVGNDAPVPGSGKSGALRVNPGCFRLARADAQRRYDDVIGNFPV
jgi:hypothetical protein